MSAALTRSLIHIVVSVALLVVALSLLVPPVAADDLPDEGDGTETNPYVITDATELQAMAEAPDANYVLGQDIDATETRQWNSGRGFQPVEDFTGTLDGQGHTIDGLAIDRPGEDRVGLFARSEGTVENVALEAADVRGGDETGVLIGYNAGEVRNVSASGTIEGVDDIGGLVGRGEGTIVGAAAAVEVSGKSVGGLIGFLEKDGEVAESRATGDVSGDRPVGGLLGVAYGYVVGSYATGDVEGNEDVGGLVGVLIQRDSEAIIKDSYATGDVRGSEEVGGLVGGNGGGRTLGTVASSYAVGEVTGDDYVAGLVGNNEPGRDSASAGDVLDSYWDIETTGQSDGTGSPDVGGTGLQTDEMTGLTAERTMDGLAFDALWLPTDEYPIFERQVESVSVTVADDRVVTTDTTDLTVELLLTDGSTVTASETADYDLDTSVATVDDGTVQPQTQGDTDITATVAGKSDTVALSVVEPPDISVVSAELTADGALEAEPVPVAVTLENTGGLAGEEAVALSIDGEEAAVEPVTVEPDAETTVTFEHTIDRTGPYEVAAAGETLGTLEVVDRDAVTIASVEAPDEAVAGDTIEVEVTVESAADVAVGVEAVYASGGEPTDSERFTVAETGTETVEFAVDTDEAAAGSVLDHEISVADASAGAETELLAPPAFEVTALDAPDEATDGEVVDLEATVENTGGVAGETTVEFLVAGEVVATEPISIEAGESATIETSVAVESSGNVDVTAATTDSEATASLAVAEGDDSVIGDGAGFGAAAAVVALVVGSVLLARRQ